MSKISGNITLNKTVLAFMKLAISYEERVNEQN